jgi:hypothetical protein
MHPAITAMLADIAWKRARTIDPPRATAANIVPTPTTIEGIPNPPAGKS